MRISTAISIINGNNRINPMQEREISPNLLRTSWNSVIISGLIFNKGSPRILSIRTCPLIASYISGIIVMQISNKLYLPIKLKIVFTQIHLPN